MRKSDFVILTSDEVQRLLEIIEEAYVETDGITDKLYDISKSLPSRRTGNKTAKAIYDVDRKVDRVAYLIVLIKNMIKASNRGKFSEYTNPKVIVNDNVDNDDDTRLLRRRNKRLKIVGDYKAKNL